MLRSYFIAAARSLMRQRAYAAINLSGLAIGVASSLLAFLYVHHEWSYDRFHANADQIHLIRFDYNRPDRNDVPMVCTPPVLGPTLVQELPGLKRVVRAYWGDMNDGVPVSVPGAEPLTARGVLADAGFFELFSFPQVAGAPGAALDDVDGMVLSAGMATRCFGSGDPIGQALKVVHRSGAGGEYVVKGVVDVPGNSSIAFDFAISHRVRGDFSGSSWNMCHVLTFAELPRHMSRESAEESLERITQQHIPADMHREWSGDGGIRIRLLPLTDMHLTRGLRSIPAVLDPLYLVIVAGIALAVLAIACVNFVNLSLALTARRVREVGIRKTSGATRHQLMRQFLAESALVALASVALGVVLAELALPAFASTMGAQLTGSATAVAVGALVLALGIGVVAGGYPALVLSRFGAVEVLRGRLRFGGTGWFSRGLVVLQFGFSIAFAVAAFVMAQQVDYMRSRELGFDAEQVLVIDVLKGQPTGPDDVASLLPALRQARDEHPGILALGVANNRFATDSLEGTGLEIEGVERRVRKYTVDEGYLEALGIDLVEGRALSASRGTDAESAVLVNESLARLLEPGGPVPGSPMTDLWSSDRQRTIVGVVADFQARPLRYQVEPAVFALAEEPRWQRYIFMRLAPDELRASVQTIAGIWASHFPGIPLPYSFVDDDVANTLRQDGRWIPVTRYAAAVAIFIASLGVLGLTALAVNRRTREIGIRKAVGASVARLVGMLSREFTMLVVLANVLAWPFAGYAMRRWLGGFECRMDLGLGPFLLGGFAALLVAWVTMGLQTVRAAQANPIEALRYE